MDAEQKMRAKLKMHTDIFEGLCELFNNNHQLALEWLENPKPALSGRTPESFLESDPAMVRSLLQRLKYGDFS
ncbi:MbcA/ParS/Xre antitoxin family protein [Photobacterium lipolyticum]|uniref:Antitoxin Xre/MbcA/ParS-like toxin-binding domain-containing protein n=1 Tax=Photobacterium lipolyticum TaxID=266810 RepID=A0A2T3MW78_9GAMM|nr:MbcA/ParS/Xre antitoxin family protein [Photobacterium lipolyticum]PSW04190.1 hypothetical protein C9I89_14525 [Photobacterium lipolyticum]